MGSRGIHREMSLLLERRQERAFERVYRRHVGDVYRYALVVLRDPQDAESVTQATFVSAYRRHRRGERPRKSHNWLLGIAHDVCRRRSERTEPDRLNELFADEAIPTPNDIRRALDSLGFDERAALMMREGECRSYAEIAELLDLSDGEVETLIFRARQALREQFEGSFSCHQTERAISRQLDGKLPRSERKVLRAHLKACPDCGEFTEIQHRQRAALRSFERAPVPESLRSFRGRSAPRRPLRQVRGCRRDSPRGSWVDRFRRRSAAVGPRRDADSAGRRRSFAGRTEENCPTSGQARSRENAVTPAAASVGSYRWES